MELLKTTINPKAEGLTIESLNYTTSGNIKITMQNEEDLRKLKTNETLRRHGFQFADPACRKPTIIIYNLDKLLDKTGITQEIYNNNDDLGDNSYEQFESQFAPLFPLKNKNQEDKLHWVIEVTPEMRKKIQGLGWKIKTTWMRHTADDYLDATRCFRCQLYGHPAKYCSGAQSICGRCGLPGHKFPECPNRNLPPTCTPCKRAGLQSDHPVTSKTCASRHRAIKDRIKNTQYSVEDNQDRPGQSREITTRGG